MWLFKKRNGPGAAQGRKQEAWELGKTVHTQQIARLAEYLGDKSVEVRRAAISSLEQQWPTGDSIGIKMLTEKLRDPDSQIRAMSAKALGEFIPQGKTPGARQQATSAIEELLKLIEREDEEDVLNYAFIALANIDDSTLLPSFSATVATLKKPIVYLGIREISLLRPTPARQQMISALRIAEERLDRSAITGGSEEMGDYHGRQLDRLTVDVLAALEEQTGTQVPIVNSVIWNTYGAVVEDKRVVELGLYKRNLVSLPENIGELTSLRALWMTDNRLRSLPESFGNLKSLRTLLMQGNEITSLPETIVNLKSLEFLRFDLKAKTHVSRNVATWLKDQEKKLGRPVSCAIDLDVCDDADFHPPPLSIGSFRGSISVPRGSKRFIRWPTALFSFNQLCLTESRSLR